MDQTLHPSAAPGDEPRIVDVWSRTSRRYRRRAVIMLSVLALLFAGLCCFTYWLRTGAYWPWLSEKYLDLLARSFRPSGSGQITLPDFLSAPISVKDVPVHGVIMGLLFASLSSIPILVAILYRFPFAIIFGAMVMFLAAMPWLGMTVLAGCALASLRPFRFSFRYASCLMGLLPVAAYFVMASREPAGSSSKLLHHQALLYAPWVLALLGSCVICAFALAIARLINYRPGGIPPLLAMLFAIPVFLFHSQVGRDELEYRLLEQDVGPGSTTMFVSEDIGAMAERQATRRWSQAGSESYDKLLRQELARQEDRVRLQLERDRERALARCDAFIAHFPRSRHVPAVLFLKGRAQDQRLHQARLVLGQRAEYRSDVPSRVSRTTWETLVEQFPRSHLSATALYKLAVVKAREGDFDGAIASLEALIGGFDQARATTQPLRRSASDQASMFRKAPPWTGLGVDPTVLVMQARRLKELILACREDEPKPYTTLFGPRYPGAPEATVHPVQVLLRLDDGHPYYKANLEGIVQAFPDSQTRRYAELRLALLEPAISRRISRFRRASKSLAGHAAGASALFYLGEALQEDSILDEAKSAFSEVINKYPQSCWADEARKRLSSLAMLETGSAE